MLNAQTALRPQIGSLPPWLLATLAGLIYSVLAYVTLTFAKSDQSSILTVIWPCSGWMCASLLLLPSTSSRLIALAVALVGDIFVQLHFFGTPTYVILLALVSLIAPILAFLLVRPLGGENWFDNAQGLLIFVVIAIGVSAFTAACGLMLSLQHNDVPNPASFFLTWFMAELPGLFVLVPATMLLLTQRPEQPSSTGSTIEAIVLPATVCVLAGLCLITGHFELLFAVIPLLVVIAFRLGVTYTSLATILVLITGVVSYQIVPHPSGSARGFPTPLALTQLFIAVSFLTALPAAFVVRDQADLRRRLLGAQLQAEAASAAKSDFVATMSHELRSPLNAVVGFAQLLAQRPELSDGARREASNIQTASRALLTVVSDVLDYSALEQGNVALDAAPFSPKELTQATISLVQPSADAKGIDLKFDIDPALSGSTLMGDENRLRQVLLNLTVNAIKFTTAGSVRIAVRHGDDARFVRFEVTDTGMGIATADLPLLFQRFSQIDHARTRQHGGSGLGLAICKRLVDAMQGLIGVITAAGTGSTFWFEVPLPAVACEVQTAPSALPETTRGARILVVDDMELNRDVAEAILTRSGYEVETANDGLQALSTVRTSAFDLILMDVQMPGVDGYEATRRIRDLGDGFVDLPIVAMTANVAADEVERCLARGMNGHVGKPVDRSRLIRMIESKLRTA